ncbi:TnpV protein [Christensenellaceae bacterium OttesenSCG-928-K19]|nr:TnpV protein [Christensenellaceae bacterium OttesenSCG-928-K19]
MQEISYEEKDGILYPAVERAADNYPLTKYGRMHKRFLQENKPGMYTTMLTEGSLNRHCHEIEMAAQERKDRIMEQMRLKSPPPRTEDFLKTVRYNNYLSDTAEQMVMEEIVLNPTT